MANLSYQQDADTGLAVAQTQSGAAGAADVNVVSGQVAIDQTNNGVTIVPSLTTTFPLNADSTAYAASLVIKVGAGNLYGLSGYNSKASAQFIQIHDAAAVPADTAVPKLFFTVPATSNFSIDFGVLGRHFANGIVAVNSSTGPTKTIGSADVWFSGRYA